VLGLCPNENAALNESEEATPTGALVDVNLGQGSSFNVAREPKGRGIPFLFVTGYDEEVLPPRSEGVARLRKQLDLKQIINTLAEALSTAAWVANRVKTR